MENRRSIQVVLWCIILIGFAQGLFYAWNVVMTSDQEQMLTKGIRLAVLGEWEHYGNRVTGGGNVPGSLTSLVVGWPLMLWDHALSPQILVGLLQLAGLLILIRVLRGYFTPLQIIVFCSLFWLSPWRASKAILWNPSYLLFATALHLYSYDRLVKKPKNFWMSVLHLLAIALAAQLHPSALLLALISGFLFLRKALPLNWPAVVTVAALVLMSLIPYFLAIHGDAGLTPVVDEAKGNFHYGFNLLHPFSFIKGVTYWVRYSSTVFPHYIFSRLDYSRFGGGSTRLAVQYGFDSLRWLVGGLSVALGLWASGWLCRRFWRQRFRCGSALEHYILAGLAAMVALVVISPAELSHWHLYPLLPVVNIAFCWFLFERFPRVPARMARTVFCLVMIYFVLFNVMANFTAPDYYSTRFNMRTDYQAFKASVVVR